MSGISARELRQRIAGELSVRSRVSYTLLLLVAAAMTTSVGSLWLTEPALPGRTQVAFAAILAIGLSWMGFSAWVLSTRRVLLAIDQVLAAWMAVVFSGIFVAGCVALAAWSEIGRGAIAAALAGLVMLILAIALLVRARRRMARLTARRHDLEAAIAASHVRTAGHGERG